MDSSDLSASFVSLGDYRRDNARLIINFAKLVIGWQGSCESLNSREMQSYNKYTDNPVDHGK